MHGEISDESTAVPEAAGDSRADACQYHVQGCSLYLSNASGGSTNRLWSLPQMRYGAGTNRCGERRRQRRITRYDAAILGQFLPELATTIPYDECIHSRCKSAPLDRNQHFQLVAGVPCITRSAVGRLAVLRAWLGIVQTWNLNMFSLITLGTAAAFLFSA